MSVWSNDPGTPVKQFGKQKVAFKKEQNSSFGPLFIKNGTAKTEIKENYVKQLEGKDVTLTESDKGKPDLKGKIMNNSVQTNPNKRGYKFTLEKNDKTTQVISSGDGYIIAEDTENTGKKKGVGSALAAAAGGAASALVNAAAAALSSGGSAASSSGGTAGAAQSAGGAGNEILNFSEFEDEVKEGRKTIGNVTKIILRGRDKNALENYNFNKDFKKGNKQYFETMKNILKFKPFDSLTNNLINDNLYRSSLLNALLDQGITPFAPKLYEDIINELNKQYGTKKKIAEMSQTELINSKNIMIELIQNYLDGSAAGGVSPGGSAPAQTPSGGAAALESQYFISEFANLNNFHIIKPNTCLVTDVPRPDCNSAFAKDPKALFMIVLSNYLNQYRNIANRGQHPKLNEIKTELYDAFYDEIQQLNAQVPVVTSVDFKTTDIKNEHISKIIIAFLEALKSDQFLGDRTWVHNPGYGLAGTILHVVAPLAAKAFGDGSIEQLTKIVDELKRVRGGFQPQINKFFSQDIQNKISTALTDIQPPAAAAQAANPSAPAAVGEEEELDDLSQPVRGSDPAVAPVASLAATAVDNLQLQAAVGLTADPTLLDAVRAELIKTDDKLKNAEDQITSLKSEVRDKQTQVVEANEAAAAATAQARQLQTELAAANAALAAAPNAATLAAATAQALQLQTELAAANAGRNAANAALADEQATVARLTGELATANAERDAANAERDAAKAALAAEQATVTRLTAELDAAKAHEETLTNAIGQLQAQIAAGQTPAQRDAAKAALAAAPNAAAFAAEKANVARLTAYLDAANAHEETLKASILDLTAKLAAANAARDAANRKVTKLTAQLQAQQAAGPAVAPNAETDQVAQLAGQLQAETLAKQAVTTAKQAVEAQLAAEQDTVARLNDQLNAANAALTTEQANVLHLTAELAAANAALAAAPNAAAFADEQANVRHLTAELAAATARVTALTTENGQLQGELQTATQDADAAVAAQLAQVRQELAASAAEIARLEQEVQHATVDANVQAAIETAITTHNEPAIATAIEAQVRTILQDDLTRAQLEELKKLAFD